MKRLMGVILILTTGLASQMLGQTAEGQDPASAQNPAAQSVAMAQSQNPCANGERRALVFSGGALKGSFQAGAAWYLVMVRKCDFADFAGVSVGGFNAAVMAQACRTDDHAKSLTCMEETTEALVNLWQGFKSNRDILHHKFMGSIAFAIFGSEAMNDSKPLRKALNTNIKFSQISSKGRPLRFGVTSMWDGAYREIVIDGTHSSITEEQFIDFLLAGGSPPVVVKMPRNCEPGATAGCLAHQHGDGGMRSGVPISSYFSAGPLTAHGTLQQLWVLGTSVFEPGSTVLPVPCRKNLNVEGTQSQPRQDCGNEREIFGKGTEIMNRAVSLLTDTPYRRDLEFLNQANEALTWRASLQERLRAQGISPAILADGPKPNSFPVESFNADPQGGVSRPYLVGLITPADETLDLSALTKFNAEMIREQLLDGCLTADRLMEARFHLESMKEKCNQRFSGQQRPVTASKSAGK